MTRESTLTTAGPFTANGVTTAFPFGFQASGFSDVLVTLDGATVDSGNYSVALNADGTGSVTFFTAPASGAVMLYLDPVFEQQQSFRNQGPYFQREVERGFDRALERDLFMRTRTELLFGTALPTIAQRAGKFITWDAGGSPTLAGGTGSDGSLRPDIAAGTGSALVGFIQTGTGAVTRTLQAKQRDVVSAKDFGAKGDGTTDDSAAINAAATAAMVQGASLYIPSGTYILDAGISVNVGASGATSKFRVFGDGPRSTILKAKAGIAATDLLKVYATATPTQAQVFVSSLSIDGLAKANGHIGLNLQDVAVFDVSGVLVERCGQGTFLEGALIGVMRSCSMFENATGIYARKTATGAYVNAVTLDSCWLKYNSTYGLDFDEGSLLRIIGGTNEENGTAADTATGGMKVGAGVSTETGFGQIVVEGCHFERNFGYQIDVAAQTTGELEFAVRDTPIISSESGRAMRVAGAGHVKLENVVAASPGDTVNITAGRYTQIGGTISARTGTITNKPLIVNAQDNGVSGEGNVASEIHQGGGLGLRQTWVSGSAGYTLGPDTFVNAYNFRAIGAAIARYDFDGDVQIASGKGFKVAGVKVVGTQGAAVADATGGATVDAEARTALNALLARIRTHGLIAP